MSQWLRWANKRALGPCITHLSPGTWVDWLRRYDLKDILCTISLASVLYGWTHPHQMLSWRYKRQEFPLKKYGISKRSRHAKETFNFKTRPNGLRGYFWSLGEAKKCFKQLFGHWKPKSIANAVLQFSDFSRRNKGPILHNSMFLLMLLRYCL